jgi:hypothetical protein
MTHITLNTSCGEALNEANHFTDRDMHDIYIQAIENNLTEGDDDKATLVKVLLEKRKNVLKFLSTFTTFIKHSNKDLTEQLEDYIIEGPKLAKGLKQNKWDLGEAYCAINAWRHNLDVVVGKEPETYRGNEEVYLNCQNCLKQAYDDLKKLTVAFVEIDAITQMVKQL